MSFFNHYSLALIALGITGLAGYVLLRDGLKKSDVFILGVLLAAMIVAWLAVRPKATPFSNAEAIQNRIGVGVPVLLEFQSPY